MVLPIDHTNSAGVDEKLKGDWPEFLGLGDRRGHVDAIAQHSPVVTSLCRYSESGGNCIKIGLPGKLILRYYLQENRTSR